METLLTSKDLLISLNHDFNQDIDITFLIKINGNTKLHLENIDACNIANLLDYTDSIIYYKEYNCTHKIYTVDYRANLIEKGVRI